MNQLITFLIPTFNGAKHIQKTLDCIVREVERLEPLNYEILICVNGSTDETLEIIRCFDQVTSFRIIRFDQNLGYDFNLIRALRNVHSDYVWFVGDDDALLEGSVEFVSTLIRQNLDLEVLVLEPNFFSEDSEIGSFPNDPEAMIFKDSFEFLNSIQWNGSALSSLVLRKPDEAQFDSANRIVNSNWVHLAFLFDIILAASFNEKNSFAFISKGLIGVRTKNPRWETNFGNYAVVGIQHLDTLRILLKKKNARLYRIFYLLRSTTNWRDTKSGYVSNDPNLHLKYLSTQIRLFWMSPVFWIGAFPLLISPSSLRPDLIRFQEYFFLKGQRALKRFSSK